MYTIFATNNVQYIVYLFLTDNFFFFFCSFSPNERHFKNYKSMKDDEKPRYKNFRIKFEAMRA